LRPRHDHITSLLEISAEIKAQSPSRPGTEADAPRIVGQATVTGIESASESIRPGDVFAALPGAHGHGARFAAAAVARGAVAVLTDEAGDALIADGSAPGLPRVVVSDPRAVLGAVSACVYGHPGRRLTISGVTGTSGKTTTTFLLRAGLRAAGRRTGLIGTVGDFIDDTVLKTPFTTPEAPALQALLAVMVELGITHVGMEVSSHALRMGRVNAVPFAVAGFTNLSMDHLDFHADMEDYFQAKASLFDGRARREVVVIDQQWGPRLVKPTTVTVSTQGLSAHWSADELIQHPDGSTSFQVHGPSGSFGARCRIPGRYNVENTLLALAILAENDVDPRSVVDAVGSAQVRGRMERVDRGQPFLSIVDYSHKPAGVQAALAALRPATTGRLIIVLGCGGDRDRTKRAVMGEVAARDADVLVVTDDNPRSEDPADIRAAMLVGARAVPGPEAADIVEIGDRAQAIGWAVRAAKPGDTVLVAGKGHETGQEVAGTMLPFDDVVVLGQALAELGFDSEMSSS